MRNFRQRDAIHIVGLELRTHNEEAQRTIPPHWERFAREGVLARIPGKRSGAVWAVYTHFEHAGLNNQGLYSLVLGAEVPADAEVPAGLVRAVLPACERAVFEAEPGRPESVVGAWREAWSRTDLPKSFVADAERHAEDGRIEVLVGLHPSGAWT